MPFNYIEPPIIKDSESNQSIELCEQMNDSLHFSPATINSIPSMGILNHINTLDSNHDAKGLGRKNCSSEYTKRNRLLNEYLDIFDFIPMGYITLDKMGGIINANICAANQLGVQNRNGLINSDFSTFVSSENMDAFKSHLKEVLENGRNKTCVLILKKRDGTFFEAKLESSAAHDEEIKIRRFRTAISDISDLKNAEKALKESEERLDLVLEATNDGIWDWDITKGKTYASARCTEIFGVTDDNASNQSMESWTSRIHPEDFERVQKVLQDHLNKQKPYNVEYRHRHESGEYRWQNLHGTALFDENGDVFLSKIGEVINANIRTSDTASRYGGEEFSVIMPDTGKNEAIQVAERIRKLVKEETFCPKDDIPINTTVSIGIAEYQRNESPTVLLARADKALYSAKEQGPNRVIF